MENFSKTARGFPKKNTPVYIFDFDGTLADTFALAVQAANSLANRYGYKKLSHQKIAYVRDLSAQQILKILGIAWYEIPNFIISIHRHMRPRMGGVAMIKGMREVIGSLKTQDCCLGIITSNAIENVEIFLEANQCNIFNFVYSTHSIFGKSKMLRKAIRKWQLNKASVCYVGDESRDIEAAKHCGVTAVAVTWGFNSKKLLLASNPEYLVDEPHELKNLIYGLINT